MANKKRGDDLVNEIVLKPVEISVDLPTGEKKHKPGLKVSRRFTKDGQDVFDTVTWDKRSSVISDEKGNVISNITDLDVPSSWTQLATDIVAYKYFRKAGVPTKEGRETSVRQPIHRIANTIANFGEKFGYFASAADRRTYEDELKHLLLTQKAAFNSPVWFNCGLYHQYKIEGQGGSFYWNFKENKVLETKTAYRNPQCSACFILSVKDTLPGIFNLLKTESHIFKYGSGSGANFSQLRSNAERLSGGGTSSGMMSFLRVFDRAAGATKSGGTTRRAAKMVVVNISHPEIEEFIEWKVKEEKKAQALIEAGYESDFNGEAYSTVSGQNSNNSVRITDEFMKSYENDGEWQTRMVTTGEPHKTYKARQLMDKIAQAAWQCADPGVQFDTTVNEWHTCPNSGRINASNPCVTGDTLVATDQGYKKIVELTGKQVKVIGSDGKARKATRVWKTGHKPVFKLTTQAGYELKLTADHKVYTTNRGYVPASELRIDDILQLQGASFGKESIDHKLAELVGLMVGDGCLTTGRDGQRFAFLTLGNHEELIAQAAARTINDYTDQRLQLGEIDQRSARRTEVRAVNTGLRIGSSSKAIVKLLKKYAILDLGSKKKSFSSQVFNLDRKSLAAVIRGLMTADGTVANYGDKSKYISLDSTSLTLLKQTQLLLLSFGIKAKIYQNRRGASQTTNLLPDGWGGLKEYGVEQTHSLRISKESRRVFETEISFHQLSNKRAQLEKLNTETGTYAESLTDKPKTFTYLGSQDVYDLTEPEAHHFIANGIAVHNCSEYMFLDDSACNLASVNLGKFIDEKGNFDVAGYRHACRIMFIGQEIEVDLSSYPTDIIAKNSHDYRPLGLGYANLGTLLMLKGIPYDSPEATAIAGALTSIMCGHAYKASAEIAAVKGPFAGYTKNRAPMLNVMNKHRSQAYKINSKYCPTELLEAAKQDWDEAVALGEEFGYRNSQATVIAPTGTIGLLMDCDTTGIEPDFALVKFKKLAGGGSMKIVNNAVPQALKNLGYNDKERQEIIDYAVGTGSLDGSTAINRQSLKTKGLTNEEVAKIESSLKGAFDINFVFNRYITGDELYARLGITEEAELKSNFSLLTKLGYTNEEIRSSNEIICGTQMLEGAPHLKESHYPVFDCANRCGINGTRFIEPLAHVRMMAATQPFISGAISKTINMPNEATVEEVKDVYIQSWKLGIKALALYRDGSKSSQPLNTKKDSKNESTNESVPEQVIVYKPRRRRLSDERQAITHKLSIAGHEGYITVGLYEDKQPGEIFITMAKQGSVISGLMDAFATSISISLQYGVPLSVIVRKFSNSRFEPYGFTTNPQIRIAKSIVDYIARFLALKFLSVAEQKDLGISSDSSASSSQAPLELETNGSGVAVPITVSSEAAEKTVTSTEDEDLTVPPPAASIDAPPCPTCGSMTTKTGTCYTCLSCGSTTGGCS